VSEILHETRGAVAWTTLNRPQARNAMTFAMYEGLAAQAAAVAADDGIRAWVITGAGGKAFAAGTDISQFTEFRTGQDALDYETRIDRVLSAI
jgi:enoyl-CoA hydratase/carnithine racemase